MVVWPLRRILPVLALAYCLFAVVNAASALNSLGCLQVTKEYDPDYWLFNLDKGSFVGTPPPSTPINGYAIMSPDGKYIARLEQVEPDFDTGFTLTVKERGINQDKWVRRYAVEGRTRVG